MIFACWCLTASEGWFWVVLRLLLRCRYSPPPEEIWLLRGRGKRYLMSWEGLVDTSFEETFDLLRDRDIFLGWIFFTGLPTISTVVLCSCLGERKCLGPLPCPFLTVSELSCVSLSSVGSLFFDDYGAYLPIFLWFLGVSFPLLQLLCFWYWFLLWW